MQPILYKKLSKDGGVQPLEKSKMFVLGEKI